MHFTCNTHAHAHTYTHATPYASVMQIWQLFSREIHWLMPQQRSTAQTAKWPLAVSQNISDNNNPNNNNNNNNSINNSNNNNWITLYSPGNGSTLPRRPRINSNICSNLWHELLNICTPFPPSPLPCPSITFWQFLWSIAIATASGKYSRCWPRAKQKT